MKWVGRPFGFVLVGSLGALALYFLTTPTTRLTEFWVGQFGTFGALAGYGVERVVAHRRALKSEPDIGASEGQLNRQATIFLSVLGAALIIADLLLANWLGWGDVAVY